jgi:hypothetical protein
MRRLLALSIATLSLSACGAGQEIGPAGSGGAREPGPTLPDVARVECTTGGTHLELSMLKPQRDGIHFQVVNETGGDRSFSVLHRDGRSMDEDAPAGTSELVVDLSPGLIEVACGPRADVEHAQLLEIVDTDGVSGALLQTGS